jgi:hypothetical protein
MLKQKEGFVELKVMPKSSMGDDMRDLVDFLQSVVQTVLSHIKK